MSQIKKNRKYIILSPDGFTIEYINPHYRSKKKAYEALKNFVNRYYTQGYYSSVNHGRIPFEDIADYCTIHIF